MAQKDFDKFSVIKSRLKVFERDNSKYILKEIKLTALKTSMCELVKNFILKYVSKIRKAGISMPKIKDYYIKNGKIFFVCEYKGENVVQVFEGKDPLSIVKEHSDILLEVIKILKKAKKANLFLDPHIKNFVIDKNKVYYVDFSPPYLQEYNKLVIENAKDEEKGIVQKNLDAFSPDQLGYHFASDLLKENKEFKEVMEKIYSILISEGMIDTSFNNFMKKTLAIKEIEDKRIEENIFLI